VPKGLAIGAPELAELKPDPGDHVYVYDPVPVTFKAVLAPLHIAVSLGVSASVVMKVSTITVIAKVSAPQGPIPVRVYTVVTVGAAFNES
jgi:hypothetical protein